MFFWRPKERKGPAHVKALALDNTCSGRSRAAPTKLGPRGARTASVVKNQYHPARNFIGAGDLEISSAGGIQHPQMMLQSTRHDRFAQQKNHDVVILSEAEGSKNATQAA
jgi:hypothetical protein